MALFYKELDNEDLARLSFAELRKHAVRAINNTQDLPDFLYAENVLKHCIARLSYDPQGKRPNGPQGQAPGGENQQQNHGGQHRRR
jgi:hypothetical protein